MHSSERLKGIDVFVTTVAAGSFTGAADRLNLTASAVGKSIARLEARLATRLFERTTRKLQLTDAGAAFHRVCVRVLDDIESAERVLAEDATEPSGRLRIDLPATFGRRQVMGWLMDFAVAHPAVQPHISFTDRFVDVVDDGIDVAVRIGGPDLWPANLGHRFLGHERLVLCAAPGYLERRGTPRTLADLPQHDAITYGRADGTSSPWLIATPGGLTERRAVDGRVVVGNAEAQLDAVIAGLGVAQMATWLAGDALRAGALVPILAVQDIDGLPLHLVWPLGKQLLPKVDGLLKHLAKHLRIR
ncbi:LysR family transcriptional regulator [Acidovorax sp. SUPP3334]|uniref:LysR family transcriptional regulator n=1 Tax=Acidovorax sp. SUPP3334 TaxID=2920881 RepID=UPI0023DE1AA5|nr:LysR family transcriptional regulator [Acidovorax sp. SUPP3334]GKT25574.1 LysR family transcriptional regulator [Acidovorax sp. SUPP3334]